MNIKDILAKVAAGETFTDDDKAFAGSFDIQAQLDAAAGSARKKAEAEAKNAKDALAKLQAEFDDFKEANDPSRNQDATARLQARIDKLEARAKAAEDAKAAMERTNRVRAMAKEAGISAARGVDSKTIDLLVDNLTNGIDLDDGDAVKSAFESFKAANSGLLAANTIGGVGVKGMPGACAFGGKNPFASETENLTEQMRVMSQNPEQARAMASAAGVDL